MHRMIDKLGNVGLGRVPIFHDMPSNAFTARILRIKRVTGPMKNWHLLSGSVAAALVCAGCGKHSEQPAALTQAASAAENGLQQTSQPQPAPATASTQPRQTPAPAGPNAAPPSTPVNGNTANSDAALASLTLAVRKFSFEKRRMPSSVQEVIASGYISPIPQPPPGKKFVLDKKTVQVVLE
jgi:hypothetical protein